MRVWIDTPACVGNGICAEICPGVFDFDGDVAYVRDGARRLPGGEVGTVTVPRELEDAVIEAAEECPAACIFVEE